MDRKRKPVTLAALIATTAFVRLLIAGCSFYRWAEVEPGPYAVLRGGSTPTSPAARQVQSLDIDRDSRKMTLTLVAGAGIITSFVPRDREAWPSGCPTNIYSTRMEVLDITQDPLTIGATSFHRPILVRDCPRDPVRLVLRGDGDIGGARTACPYPEPCIYFVP